jgi:hypothetical protein
MYHKASISPLSNTQISKILNGHSVRVSAGNEHDIELSKEQFKKFAKAHQNGKAMTLTLDPFQIQNLRGSGNLKRTSKSNAKRLITSATDRAIRALEGSGAASDLYVRAHQKDAMNVTNRYAAQNQRETGEGNVDGFHGYGIGGNIKAVGKDSGKRLIISGTDRLIRSIDGSGVNRLKKGQRWEQFANATVRDGIDTAGKAARVYYDSTDPMAQMGFGIGGNIKAVGKDSGKRLIISGTDRLIRSIDGSGFNDFQNSVHSGLETVMTGKSVNRLKKGQRWESFANATLRDGIDTAGKAARVYYDNTNPMAQMGFGLRKRGRPKRGGALYVAGTP